PFPKNEQVNTECEGASSRWTIASWSRRRNKSCLRRQHSVWQPSKFEADQELSSCFFHFVGLCANPRRPLHNSERIETLARSDDVCRVPKPDGWIQPAALRSSLPRCVCSEARRYIANPRHWRGDVL